jgi:hypothetical protein
MAYYVLHIGKSRFNLINNYTFEKFFEVIEIASNLKVSERVLETFHKALCVAGHTPDAASAIIANLRNGAAPFASSAAQELATRIRLDVSDSAKLNAAHREAGGALGREQLGVCLRSSLYRRFLLAEHHESPHLRSLQSAKTLAERGQALVEIESSHPEYLERGIQYLDQRFAEMRRKLPFTATAREILTNVEVTVNSQELLERVEEKRTALIHAKNSILRALKGENPQLAALEKGLRQRRRALRALQEGLAHNPALQSRIEEVSREISALEENSSALGLSYIDERYANLDENARREAIAAEQQELVSIEEKEPALVFIALVMESVGAESITEDELSLLREISSHLSHPFEVLREISKLDTRARAISKEQEVHYRLIPKRDLVTMARFADSKICCFSSTNYDMQVAHNTPNKYWVAAILADPLSFVFEIQDVPESQESGSFLGRPVVQNLGFNFGMFGTDSEENLTIFLNGVYLSTGNDAQSSASVLSATETLLSRPMRAAWQAVATKHGGNIGSAISGYNPEAFEGTRLRALTDKRGHDPVLNVYDDLGTKVNQECTFKALRKKVPKEKSQ